MNHGSFYTMRFKKNDHRCKEFPWAICGRTGTQSAFALPKRVQACRLQVLGNQLQPDAVEKMMLASFTQQTWSLRLKLYAQYKSMRPCDNFFCVFTTQRDNTIHAMFCRQVFFCRASLKVILKLNVVTRTGFWRQCLSMCFPQISIAQLIFFNRHAVCCQQI